MLEDNAGESSPGIVQNQLTNTHLFNTILVEVNMYNGVVCDRLSHILDVLRGIDPFIR